MNGFGNPGLASLPAEVQGTIASFLLRRTDLNALSRTCKTLRDTSLPKLYHRVELRIPAGKLRVDALDALENLLLSSGQGLKSTKQLRILPQQGPLHDDEHTNRDTRLDVENAQDHRSGSQLFSITFNILIRQLLKKIPIRCLQMFEWRHTCPIDEPTLALLFERQQLSCLRLEGLSADLTRNLSLPTISGLEELRFGSIYQGQIVDWVASLVARNFATIKVLEIGAEKIYRHNDSYPQLTESFRHELGKRLVDLHDSSSAAILVKSLTLVGLDSLAFEDGKNHPIIDWRNLQALALKSCSQLNGMLIFLQSATIKSGGAVSLKSFHLRGDLRNCTVEAVKNFLTSFNGLLNLSLLLEDHITNVKLSEYQSMLADVLENHGPTLRRFIWDIRSGERRHFYEETSKAEFENKHVVSISKFCPWLEELGLSFNWPVLMQEPKKKGGLTLIEVVQCIVSLKHLRTLHIRNLPSFQGQNLWPGVSEGEYCEGFITKLARALVRSRPEQPPILDTIAIGILRNKDLCGESLSESNERLDKFLKLRVYHVEYRRNFQGDCIPIITLIAKGTTDAIQDEYHNLDILQLDWTA